MKGIQNISDRIISRVDGQAIFVISVPLIYEGQIIGSIQKQYTPEEMYDICAVSLFSEQGHAYIINSDGYILISSEQDAYSREAENYFRMLYANNPDQSAHLQKNIKANRPGFMENQLNGKKFFSAYTSIDEIDNWYLVTSMETKAVSPNANKVIKLFYVILLAVAIFFGLSLLYYLKLKNKQQTKLEGFAFIDTITGGDTFAKFNMDLQSILSVNNGKQYYILAFDIDNFKYINSFYGFMAGDKILKRINQLYTCKLKGDERVARVYTDHFVMLLEDVSEDRLKEFFNSEMSLDDITVYLSAGLYPITDREESVNLMIDKANLAARKMKGKRFKRIEVYSDEFDKQVVHSEQMKRAVEQALARGEIIPYFQPKVDINSGKLVGAEALARWKREDGEVISPAEFIPVCERTGMIVQVDMAVFEHTLQFIKSNLEKGVECVPISVNFSRMHLLNEDFSGLIFGKLEQYKVPPSLIELELTETVIFDNYQVIEDLIDRFHEKGVQISMDDFGSGYSSLHMLKDIDIDVLKIDRGFLKDTANSDRQKVVFGAVAQMAEHLQIKVVVEGVENIDNIQLMKEFGCSVAQGFFYARPMSEDDFTKCYQEGKVCENDVGV